MLASFSSSLINVFIILALLWLVTLITVLFRLSRRNDITLPLRMIWSAVIVFAPVAGLLAYLIYGPKKRI